MKNKSVILNNIEYEIIRDDDCFDHDTVQERIAETDYFDKFDYILGDIAYDKVRLKGYYNSKNKNASKINDYKNVEDYIKNYCQTGSKIFILEKKQKNL